MAKRREELIIYVDILTAVLDGPKLRTRLAQTCNLSYDNFVKYASKLESSKLVERKQEEGHDLYAITPEGLKFQDEFRKNLLRLKLSEL